MAVIGKPINRVDAVLKVTGAAKYAAEFNPDQMVYAFPVRSTIAKGSVIAIDAKAAEKTPGVIKVLSHLDAPQLKKIDPNIQTGGSLGEQLIPLQDDKIYYFGQYIALVIAESYETARAAASLVNISYKKEKHAIDLKEELRNGYKPQKLQGEEAQLNEGKAASVIDAAQLKIEQIYTTPTENHHPMEPHATIAIWDGEDKLTVYDATQGVMGERAIISYYFGLPPENVKILSPFVGGGFGCKGSPWGHIFLAAMAAKVTQRPAKLAITRQMMQTNVGRRAATEQTIALATNQQGNLTAIRHHTDSYGNKSEFFESSGKQTAVLYSAPIREITYKIAKLNIGTPTYMRAPGETPGTFALESAMDEMAYKIKMDPIEFRVLNHTSEDPVKKHPFSSENLLECYKIGAEKIGWNQRKSEPRQLRNGSQLIGFGMATATYPANRSAASARIELAKDGTVTVFCATQDIGTGTYTILTQTASDALGVPVEKITVKLGDSSLPPAPVSGGSQTTASVNPAVLAAGEELRKNLLKLTLEDVGSPLKGKSPADIDYAQGRFFLKAMPSVGDSYGDIVGRSGKDKMDACTTAMPGSGTGLGTTSAPCMIAEVNKDQNSDKKTYSFHSFGAQFVEVWVDEDLGTIRVKRFVSVQDVGKIMNEKTARSQIMGGVIYGIGAALMEETSYDQRWANPVTRTFADYHVPVNLDVPEIDIHFIGKTDPHISTIGARGVGEIGITGVAAAIANAVFNATGKRLRDLPLTPDKLFI